MQKPKSFRPWQPDQTSLLPPSPREWLADDHQVYFLLDLVDELDLSQILGPAEAKDPRGEKGFDPRMMTMLLLYAYCVGIVSSRKIERACYEDLAFRVLTANQQPDHSRISEFRRRNLDALKDLFVQILRLCQKAGMVSLGHVALDGTKVQANASKHKAMSHERMLRAEKELEKEINALMRRAEILDAQDDKRYGKGKLGSDLPDELRRRQDRLARIRQARKEMEAETAAATARQRQEEAEEARARAAAAREADAPDAEQAELNSKAETVVKASQPFERIVLTKEQALTMFADNPFKAQLIRTKNTDCGYTTAYRCGPLIDLCRGPHVPTTGAIKAFEVTKHSSRCARGGSGVGVVRGRARG
jgi:transposase